MATSRENSYLSTTSMVALMMAFFVLMCCTSSANAFSITMDYRPPVKTSVKKLVDRTLSRQGELHPRRRSAGSPGSKTHHNRYREAASASSAALSRTTTSSARSAAFGATLPLPTDNGVASFERRMREMALGNQQTRQRIAEKQKKKRTLPANVKVVETLNDYKKVVGDETDKLVAVRFYAPWCRACKAVAPLFYHIANTFPDTVVFVDVPVTDRNANIHQGLGVPSLPFCHVYHPSAGLVEEMPLTRKHVGQFKATLDQYVQGHCELLPKNPTSSEEDDSES